MSEISATSAREPFSRFLSRREARSPLSLFAKAAVKGPARDRGRHPVLPSALVEPQPCFGCRAAKRKQAKSNKLAKIPELPLAAARESMTVLGRCRDFSGAK
jgi:hypothetical protein